MPGVLYIQPAGEGNVIPFGPVVAATTLNLSVALVNNGNTTVTFQTPSLTLTPIVGAAGDFAITSTLPTGTLAPGASVEVKLSFTPSSPDATVESATLTIASNSTMSPKVYTLTGTSATTADVFVQMTASLGLSQPSPAIINFGSTATGVSTTSAIIVLKNTTAANVTVTLTPLTAKGYSVTPVGGSNPITPVGTYSFTITLKPVKGNVGAQDDADAVTVSIPSQSFPQTVEASYYIPPVTPAFVTTDQIEGVMMGFLNIGSGVATTRVIDPFNLNCEEDATFVRQFDMQDPASVKQLSRILMRYERLGATTVGITYATVSPTGQPPVVQSRILNIATDGLLMDQLFDGSIAGGSIIQLTVTVAANGGPLSVTLLTPYVEPRGEIIEAT